MSSPDEEWFANEEALAEEGWFADVALPAGEEWPGDEGLLAEEELAMASVEVGRAPSS